MHTYSLNAWQHNHVFTAAIPSNERKTLGVVLLTAGMMGVEIIAGALCGSMALLADGWHMGTHAAALGITLFAYRYASRNAHNPRYTFGTGKVSALSGFASAVVLLVIAGLMMLESVERLFSPPAIRFGEAIVVAGLGLIVNLVSMRWLGNADHHPDDHEHAHSHAQADHNLKAAYLHVLADALTSGLAIIALVAGSFFGWVWLDAAMGIVGGLVISRWAVNLLRETGHLLLDGQANAPLVAQIRSRLEANADTRIADLHVWQVGEGRLAAIISLVMSQPRRVADYRKLLVGLPALAHVTIEINVCGDEGSMPEIRQPAVV